MNVNLHRDANLSLPPCNEWLLPDVMYAALCGPCTAPTSCFVFITLVRSYAPHLDFRLDMYTQAGVKFTGDGVLVRYSLLDLREGCYEVLMRVS